MQVLSRHEIALLEATLLDGEAALAAFARWRALFDFEGEHEAAAFGLLPLLHANMTRLGSQDPVMARLGGVRRYGWTQGQRRQSAAIAAVRMLAAGAIPVMLPRGPALAEGYYPEAALRPRQDVDLLVHAADAEAALGILAQGGWKPQAALPAPGASRASFIALHPGIGLRGGAGIELTLNWRAIGESSQPGLERWLWDKAEPLDLGAVRALRPGPGQLLFHTLCNGLQASAAPSLLWVVDTAMILRKRGGAIDWPVFWDMARQARLEMRLAEGLAAVARLARLELPPAARRKARRSAVELLEGAALSRTRNGARPGLALWMRRLAKVLRLGQGHGLAGTLRLIAAWPGLRRAAMRPAGQSPC